MSDTIKDIQDQLKEKSGYLSVKLLNLSQLVEAINGLDSDCLELRNTLKYLQEETPND